MVWVCVYVIYEEGLSKWPDPVQKKKKRLWEKILSFGEVGWYVPDGNYVGAVSVFVLGDFLSLFYDEYDEWDEGNKYVYK